MARSLCSSPSPPAGTGRLSHTLTPRVFTPTPHFSLTLVTGSGALGGTLRFSRFSLRLWTKFSKSARVSRFSLELLNLSSWDTRPGQRSATGRRLLFGPRLSRPQEGPQLPEILAAQSLPASGLAPATPIPTTAHFLLLLFFQFPPLPGHGLLGSQPPGPGPASRIRNSISTSQHFPSNSVSTYL